MWTLAFALFSFVLMESEAFRRLDQRCIAVPQPGLHFVLSQGLANLPQVTQNRVLGPGWCSVLRLSPR